MRANSAAFAIVIIDGQLFFFFADHPIRAINPAKEAAYAFFVIDDRFKNPPARVDRGQVTGGDAYAENHFVLVGGDSEIFA